MTLILSVMTAILAQMMLAWTIHASIHQIPTLVVITMIALPMMFVVEEHAQEHQIPTPVMTD